MARFCSRDGIYEGLNYTQRLGKPGDAGGGLPYAPPRRFRVLAIRHKQLQDQLNAVNITGVDVHLFEFANRIVAKKG